MSLQTELVTKSKFAEVAGVGKSAVSNWIERQIINGDAIVGEGRRAKINLHLALAQVRQNRDIGQALSNGIGTRTFIEDEPPSTAAAATPKTTPPRDADGAPSAQAALPMQSPSGDTENEPQQSPEHRPREDRVEEQLKRAKLEQQLRINRREAEQDALDRGALMSSSDAREQMGRIAAGMLQMFEGALPGFSEVLAERFDIPQRDVLHLMREHFREVRKEAADKDRNRAQGAQKTVLTEVGG